MASEFQVAVIGGGVNGSGIARDLALRGVHTLLLEKNDFSAGTTGACSGMIHGGARYLQSDVETTKMSCLDSGYIQKIAPHLLFRIPFLTPILRSTPFARIFLELLETYFEAYDRFSPLKRGKPHTRLTREEALELEPGINPDIVGAVTMDEWGIDTFRLCAMNALSAAEAGAEVRNHTEVSGFLQEGSRVRGLRVRNLLTGAEETIRAEIVMNAAGPWLPEVARLAGVEVKIRPGKGVHLIFDRRISNLAIFTFAIDGRQIFLMPHENGSILGTTDDDYYGSLDQLEATQDEIEYLLEGIERVFPPVRRGRISRVMTGIRITLYAWGKNEDALSREHEIVDHEEKNGIPGFLTIAGGKLASYRLMSEEAADLICRKLGVESSCRTHLLPLPGGDRLPSRDALVEAYRIPPYLAERLIRRYGSRVDEVLEGSRKDPSLLSIVCRCEPVIEAEIRYAIRKEWARNLVDLRRRTKLGTGPCQGCRCAQRAALILAEELKLSSGRVKPLIRDFLAERWRGKAPILALDQLAQEELTQALYRNLGCHGKFF